MNDIKIKTNEINFKYRVSGIIIINNKLLVTQIMDNGFYCLPGGHVKLGEISSEAIKREIIEEFPKQNKENVEIDNSNLVAINEILFTRKDLTKIHELTLIYKVNLKDIDDIKLNNVVSYENDEGVNKKLEFKWVELDDLKNINFKPKNLINKIVTNDFSLAHLKEQDK